VTAVRANVERAVLAWLRGLEQESATALADTWDDLPIRTRRDRLALLAERVEVHPPNLADGKRWGRATFEVVPRHPVITSDEPV
jgi:hypothetical protein